MAELPSANVTVEANGVAGAGGGTGYLAIFAAVAQNADVTPRVYSSSKSLIAQHGYSPGASYAAMHFAETRKPVVFVGLPIETQGTVGRVDDSGVTGTSVITAVAGGSGALEAVQAILRVLKGGTIGSSQILCDLSLDNGESFTKLRLGTNNSYTIPYVGVTLNFAAGTLVADDEFTFSTTAPRWDGAGITAARAALATQNKYIRSILVVGDLIEETDATDVLGEVNEYETSNKRFTFARAQLRDRLPHAALSSTTVRMTGSPTLTFAEVGGTGDTVTRSSGSWITDGFAIGDIVTFAGSASNNVTGPIANLSATVLTFGTTDLVAEGPVSNCTAVAHAGITFAEVGGTGDTIVRSRGSWLEDGFRDGDIISVDGSASNDVTGAVTTVTATTLTMGSTDLAAEVISAASITVTTGETKAAWIADLDAEFASVRGTSSKRIDLGVSMRPKKCPITGSYFRRPVQWAASLREYSLRDIHIATWRNSDGALRGWLGGDADEEFDERADGGALAAGFTCFRTWDNEPEGSVFIAQSITRDDEDSLLSQTHNLAVTNLACTTCQKATQKAVGESLILNANGTGSQESLGLIKGRVDKALQLALLQDNGEGPRASSAYWTPSSDDILNVPNARLHGVLSLNLRGTLVHIDTSVVVQTGGA